MKKILGMIASPRKLGNCEILIKEIGRNIPHPHDLTLIRFSDFRILPCRGCYRCLFDEGGCTLQDDFYVILNAILGADALVLASPTYFLGPNAALKRFIDRGLAFYAHAERLWAKPAVGIGIAGIQGKEGYTLLGIESFLKLLMAEVKKTVILYGALPGEVFIDNTNKREAVALASALFSPAPERRRHSCPLCGGETFRFLGADRVRCMLCSNSGIVRWIDAEPVFDIKPGPHELFLSRSGVLKHRKWLMGMKERFIDQKKQLREITAPYRKEGIWLKPDPCSDPS